MVEPRHSTTMENLPTEVLSEIFTQLLAKQLAQMRCICKSWNALLCESSFVKSHLHHSIHKKDEILLFFHKESYSAFTARPSRSPNLELTNLIKLPVNLYRIYRVIGSVNGLICFYYKLYIDYAVGIWNPSLSAMLTLPSFSLAPGESEFGFGFGFDPKTDDYKVVKITRLSEPARTKSQVEVYSMKKGSWESKSHRFPSHLTLFGSRINVCVDDHLHWLGRMDDGSELQMIVAFDLGTETFSEIPLPDSILHYNWRYSVVGVFAGKLCVMMSRGINGSKYEVWVMEEYGVAESWVKHHAFSQFSGDISPYGFTSNSEFLFQDDDRFSLYDPVAAKTKTFKIMSTSYDITKVVEYVDSLVWIEPPKQLQM